jgi:hypothetical protein
VTPALLSRSCVVGVFSVSAVASSSRRVISGGVPFGKKKPLQK